MDLFKGRAKNYPVRIREWDERTDRDWEDTEDLPELSVLLCLSTQEKPMNLTPGKKTKSWKI